VAYGDKCIDCGNELTPMNAAYRQFILCTRCIMCFRKYNLKKHNEWKSSNPQRMNELALRARFKAFGLTTEQYNELVEFQQGACAICRKPCVSGQRLSVDHDHETDEVRGLLCKHCNAAMGMLKEDEDIIFNMMEYLKKHKWSKKTA
jgi:hypothetical protein